MFLAFKRFRKKCLESVLFPVHVLLTVCAFISQVTQFTFSWSQNLSLFPDRLVSIRLSEGLLWPDCAFLVWDGGGGGGAVSAPSGRIGRFVIFRQLLTTSHRRNKAWLGSEM